ncbi:MAG: site-specific integrase [Thaumarchaeota archaeon]|nr:site-specific integrase [Nitrososphaerota archaeon]
MRWSKINRLKPERVIRTGREAWKTDEIIKMLSFTSEIRTKTLIHFIASSGIRIGALEDIKIRHIKQIEDCKSVLVYEGALEEYVTFLTPEASSMFDDYVKKRETDGERINSVSPAFRSTYQLGFAKVRPASTDALKEVIRKLIIKSGLRINQVKTGERYNKQADHAFRKRWNTILKTTTGMNISLAEKMMGHSVTVVMDNVYLDPTVEQLFAEFRKAIPELTIDSTLRQEIEIIEKNQKITELQEKNQKIEELQKAQMEMKNRLDKIDLEEKLTCELGISEEKLIKALKERADNLDELMVETQKLRKEYNKEVFDID